MSRACPVNVRDNVLKADVGRIQKFVDPPSHLSRVCRRIIGVMAQRLVRRICPDCAEPYEPSISELTQLGVQPRITQGFSALDRMRDSAISRHTDVLDRIRDQSQVLDKMRQAQTLAQPYMS